MEINIEISSREFIKPFSSTPESLKKYQLSFLDQIAPPCFMPLIYFYPFQTKVSTSQVSNELKSSLSRTLTKFYPLAGRMVDIQYVDCNDEGVLYVEAQSNCDLIHVIKNPVPKDMSKFIPYTMHDVQNHGMGVQVTFFRCGGTAVGLAMSHKIVDALSFIQFANSWATIARCGNDATVPQPIYEGATIFPPRDMVGFKPGVGVVKEELVTKIFTFPASKIRILKERYSSNGYTKIPQSGPTRVEALTTFIWTRFISATELKPDPNKVFTLLHAINLRTRLNPPLSEEYFGNITQIVIAMPEVREGEIESGDNILQKMREAMRSVNVVKIQDGGDHLNLVKERMSQVRKKELVSLNFTSLCRFPLYEADFGWGKPVWVGSLGLPFKNLVTFIDTVSGDGIETWINLKKEDMNKFEADLELQDFLSPSS